MRSIEHGALLALSPNTRTRFPAPYRSAWLVSGYLLIVAPEANSQAFRRSASSEPDSSPAER